MDKFFLSQEQKEDIENCLEPPFYEGFEEDMKEIFNSIWNDEAIDQIVDITKLVKITKKI